MHARFSEVIESLHPSFERLLAMSPLRPDSLSRRMPQSGIYLFTEGHKHLYVGRSNLLRSRIRRHCVANAGHNVATFAFKIARQQTGKLEASYRPDGSRDNLLKDPEFAAAFSSAKERVRAMDVRFIEEADQLKQSILELYVAVVLDTAFNDFGTY